MEMLSACIAEKRTTQRFVLIEGLCNSNKLASEDDQYNLRFMDELFAIEKCLGEVNSVISLTYNKEEDYADYEMEKFEEKEEEEKPAPQLDEDGNPIAAAEDAPAEGDPDAPKVVKFDPADLAQNPHGWTIQDRKSKNLMQLFCNMKGNSAFPDIRDAENYSKQNYTAVTAGLDEFCERISADEGAGAKNLYLQVVFSDQ